MPGKRSIQLLGEGKLQTLHHLAKLVQRIFLFFAHKERLHPLLAKLTNHRREGSAHCIQREVGSLGEKAGSTIRGHDILGNNAFTKSKLIQGDTPNFFHFPLSIH
jgi:hypothetical protein